MPARAPRSPPELPHVFGGVIETQDPLLTDLPLGCWASAFLLDLLGLGSHRDAARRLVGLGLLASPPTAAADLSDWSRLATPDRRVGLVHAQLHTLVWSSTALRRSNVDATEAAEGSLSGFSAAWLRRPAATSAGTSRPHAR